MRFLLSPQWSSIIPGGMTCALGSICCTKEKLELPPIPISLLDVPTLCWEHPGEDTVLQAWGPVEKQ